MKKSLFLVASGFLIFAYSILLITAQPLRTVEVRGFVSYYDSGGKVSGNISVYGLEEDEFATTTFTGGDWQFSFDMTTDKIEWLTFKFDDNDKIGYSRVKLSSDNASAVPTTCYSQDIKIAGHGLNMTGDTITDGSVTIALLDTEYFNSTSFSSNETWSTSLHPCLINGTIYTLQIQVADEKGNRGEMMMYYPAG